MDTLSGSERYRICTRCIIDSSDYPEIIFDEQGVCNMCHNYDDLVRNTVLKGAAGQQKLDQLLKCIKHDGTGKAFDCLLGISGGVDSSYMAWLCKQWGLRPLFVHVDNGWNSELAVDNIERILNKLGFQLHTEVLNWPVMRDLQHAFIKANVVDLDLPTDNAFAASVYNTAHRYNIKYVLTGTNTATEGNLPPNFNHFKFDIINIKDIHKRFGNIPLRNFPLISRFKMNYYNKISGIQTICPLNWLDFNKAAAKDFLKSEFGWRDYGGKHYENIFTRFYQGYILPEKFGVDKRKAHLSHMVCSGQMTREEALKEVKETTPYSDLNMLKADKAYFLKKMKMSPAEFEAYLLAPPVSHRAYRSVLDYYEIFRPFKRLAKRILNFTRNT